MHENILMYKEYQPCHLLSPYIDKYWEFKGCPNYGTRINILPDGCTDFIFTLGEAAKAMHSNLLMKPYQAYFVGPMNTYSELVTDTKSVHMLGVRFLPCGLSHFIKLPLHELTNLRLNADEVPTLFEDSFAERLCEQINLQSRIHLIENYLINYLCHYSQTSDTQIIYAVNQINQHKGKLSIQSLVDDICLCQRQFERKFKRHTGFTPKEYSRIIKFRNAIDLLRTESYENLLSIAIHAGYYDVPHLSREIKKMSGSTACSFLAIPPDDEIGFIYVE